MISFEDKVLAMNGANGGIARATAERFHDAGAKLFLTDIDAAALADFAASLDPGGRRIVTVPQDVSQAGEAEAAAAACREAFGEIDFLVPAAGLYRSAKIAEMPVEEWRRSIAVNLDGIFYTCQAFLPLMRDGGSIVTLSSLAAERGSHSHAHYSAAKGATISFTRSLALEVAPRLRANCVSPGIIDTVMVQSLMAAKGDALLDATPLGRMGTADEVAGTIAFLCSDLAAFITGETLQVNGGIHIR